MMHHLRQAGASSTPFTTPFTAAVYGLALRSNRLLATFPPAEPVTPFGEVALQFCACTDTELAAYRAAFNPVRTIADGRAVQIVDATSAAHEACTVIRFPNAGDFVVYEHGRRIEIVHRREIDHALLELHLLTLVLPFYLDRLGATILHGSAVIVRGRAVAFLAPSGGGKSGMAATFLADGFPLLTDDLLVLMHQRGAKSRAMPGGRTLSMWADELSHFGAPTAASVVTLPDSPKHMVPLDAVNTQGAYQAEPVDVGCMYVLDRRPLAGATEPSIAAIGAAQAVFELFGCTYLVRTKMPPAYQKRRYEIVLDLAASIPVRKLSFPSGFDRLPDVRSAVLDDLDTLFAGF